MQDFNDREQQGNEYTFQVRVPSKNEQYELDIEPEYYLSDLYDSISEVAQIDKLKLNLIFGIKRIPNDPNITLKTYFRQGRRKPFKIECLKQFFTYNRPISFKVRAYQIKQIYEFTIPKEHNLYAIFNKIKELTKIDQTKQRLCLVYANEMLIEDEQTQQTELGEIFGQNEEQKEIGCFIEKI